MDDDDGDGIKLLWINGIWMMERPSINRQLGWGYTQLYSPCFSWINWIETTKHDVSNGGISTKTKVLVQILVEWTSCFSWTKVSNRGISTKHECVFGWIWPSDSYVFLYFLFCGRWLPLGQKKIKGEQINVRTSKNGSCDSSVEYLPFLGWSSHNPTVIRSGTEAFENRSLRWKIGEFSHAHIFFRAKRMHQNRKIMENQNQPTTDIFLPRLVTSKLSFESQQPCFLVRPRRFRITHDGSMVLVYMLTFGVYNIIYIYMGILMVSMAHHIWQHR